MGSPKALHSKSTPRWGTPQALIEIARTLLDGQIHLDPASSAEFNRLVQALIYYTETDNGLIQPWAGNVFVNPPGGLVVEFWDRLVALVLAGQVEKAFWVGFSVEQLCILSSHTWSPVDFSCCILRKRLAFNTEALVPGGSPSHGNYVTAIGVDHALFEKLFQPLGKVIRGPYAV